ncbi:MAG: aminopeptidase P N-terminal domain-containing protein, partial [Myxococcota bacterium]|nr:aminopeptidase P N-terminal domain-containing protein [Myxococcota bacterium]
MNFQSRRDQLLGQIADGVGLFFSAPERRRNYDVFYPYRQDSNFYYLTGFEEPSALLVLCGHRAPGDQSHLFLRERDPAREIWDGHRLGLEAAPSALQIDQAHSIEALSDLLPKLLEGASALHYAFGDESEQDQQVLRALKRSQAVERRGGSAAHQIVDLSQTLHLNRWRKSPEEQAQMRAAAELAALGHQRAMECATPGIYEYQLQAEMERCWRLAGSPRNAYPSIVGSGPMACILHYHENQRRCEAGDLVLIDAGCELGYYASDITRTWPVSGKFTKPQRALYELTLAAQEAAIERCRVGESLKSVHDRAVEVLVQGLCDLSLLQESPAEAIETQSY